MIITPESVRDFCLESGAWVTRLMIARGHGKRKTTHVMQTITRARDMGYIHEEPGFDVEGRPCLVYRAILADEYPED